VAQQLLRPRARSAGELEYVAGRAEGVQRRDHLVGAGGRERMLVVLGRDRA
jgi:hypothetical protein